MNLKLAQTLAVMYRWRDSDLLTLQQAVSEYEIFELHQNRFNNLTEKLLEAVQEAITALPLKAKWTVKDFDSLTSMLMLKIHGLQDFEAYVSLTNNRLDIVNDPKSFNCSVEDLDSFYNDLQDDLKILKLVDFNKICQINGSSDIRDIEILLSRNKKFFEDLKLINSYIEDYEGVEKLKEAIWEAVPNAQTQADFEQAFKAEVEKLCKNSRCSVCCEIDSSKNIHVRVYLRKPHTDLNLGLELVVFSNTYPKYSIKDLIKKLTIINQCSKAINIEMSSELKKVYQDFELLKAHIDELTEAASKALND